MVTSLLEANLGALGIGFKLIGTNDIVITDTISSDTLQHIKSTLCANGVNLVDNLNLDIVDRIKLTINELLEKDELRQFNTSDYIADKLNYSYAYLSKQFSETTFTSIENYIILKKVDKAKDLLLTTDSSLTEIAFKLDYSSVAHLSRQFKKTTGLTPSMFQKIIKRRTLQVAE